MAKNTEEVEVEEAETAPTEKQVINEGIARVIEATGIDVQKNRYKAMRAIAFQAFLEAIESDDFDGLVDRAIENVDALPSGWEIERPEKAEVEAKAKPVKKATTKSTSSTPKAKAGKTSSKTQTRRRPRASA